MNRISSVFSSPLFLSFLVSALLVFILVISLPSPSRYVLRQQGEVFWPKVPVVLYDDLDNNGYSDEIDISEYAAGNGLASVMVHMRPSIALKEWDFRGGFPFGTPYFFQLGDFDRNGQKEMYLFTISADSVFLNSISGFTSNPPFSSRRFVTTIKLFNGAPHMAIFPAGLHDMDRDGYLDFVFAISSGFSIEPRRVYIYDIHKDSLSVSPVNGYFFSTLQITDLTGDGFNEIILNGYATQNIQQDTNKYPIHDLCCWLIVLDHRLQYLFPPRKFPWYGYSELWTTGMTGPHGSKDLYSIYFPPESSGKLLKVIQWDNKGRIVKFRSIPGISYSQARPFHLIDRTGRSLFGLATRQGSIIFLDTSLRETGRRETGVTIPVLCDTLDVDQDGQKEVITLDASKYLLTVFRIDFRHPASIRLSSQDWTNPIVSLKSEPGKPVMLAVYSHNSELLLKYGTNPYYYTRWALYAGIFFAVYLFALLIRKVQVVQIEKQQRMKQKITELQLKIVRNQMDPHFTLNAVNSVIASIQQNEREEAAQHLLHFSAMYRHLLLTADKIKCTLGEEIEFTRNYLIMEQFRYRDRFRFGVYVEPEVSLAWEVPKMVIQSPVENAVRHGLLNLEGEGRLDIRVGVRDHQLLMEISDNGIGRKKASELNHSSTGTGIKTMREFLGLFQKVTGVTVDTEIRDLADAAGNPAGTSVVVCIELAQIQEKS